MEEVHVDYLVRYQTTNVQNPPATPHAPPLTSQQSANRWKSERKTGNSC